MYVETVPVRTGERDTHVLSNIWWVKLECPVCACVADGIALRKQFIFGPRRGRFCRLNSCHAPCTPWPVVWLVGTHNAKHRFRGRELPDLSHLTQAIRDTENKLRWRVKLGLNESERLGFANMMNKRVVPCNALQDPEVEQVIRFFHRI